MFQHSPVRKLFLLLVALFASILPSVAQIGSRQEPSSNIVSINLNDSSFFKVVLRNALYDFSRNRIPYYQHTKSGINGQQFKCRLIIKQALSLSEQKSEVIKKCFGNYLSSDFELRYQNGISINENIACCSVVPFRINNGRVEELVSYDIAWENLPETEATVLQRGSSNFTTSSVLASGNWYKIGIVQTGVYKLSRDFLKDIGVNMNGLDPRKIRIFGNGGRMIPERNKDFRYDDLKENAIMVAGESDGVFDAADYVVFYATGTAEWKRTKNTTGLRYAATTNLYSDTSFYFINTGQANGLRMASLSANALNANTSTSTYDYYNYHEKNLSNFGKSGREFYGEYFDYTTSYSFKWDDGDFVTGDTLVSEASAATKHSDVSFFEVRCGSSVYTFTTRALNFNSQYEDYASQGGKAFGGYCTDAGSISLTISKQTAKSVGWLNKVTVNARRRLAIRGNQFNFRDSRISGSGKVCRYTMTNFTTTSPLLLNVSDYTQPYIQEYEKNGNLVEFNATADSTNEYCVITNDYLTPSFVKKIPNQNLHSKLQADYILVSHPLFLKEAEELGAFHQQKEGFSYLVASTEEIYNEFGSGKQDPSAIRDFIRMLYSRNLSAGKQVRYVALIGDGSYKNKERNITNNTNFIPTYQSFESLSELMSIATDDFYAMMDDNEGLFADVSGTVDVGIGRLICRTNAELKAILGKIYNYYKKDENITSSGAGYSSNESVTGDWRNWVLFLADDGDGATHMIQSNQLAGVVSSYAPSSNLDKIFIDAYKRYSTAGGLRYPDASEEFIKRMKKGALIFNYTGHGGEVGLTGERMVDIDIINSLDNYNRLALFITATCEFSRYDDPGRTSAGELCLLNPKGAAVALFTTCRIAFSLPNYTLNAELLENIFSRMPNGKRPTLGDVIRKTKATTGQSLVANFHLLGDPAMTLAYPDFKVSTSAINNKNVSISVKDTLSALAKINVKGQVTDTLGNKLNSFNGLVFPTVFDREQSVRCLLNSESSAINYYNRIEPDPYFPFEFKSQKNILYRGKVQVVNGEFNFSFLVPKDISFAYGPGRISYYATNGVSDAVGNYTNLVVGGASKNVINDSEGPVVDLYLNDKNYVSGAITNEEPVLFADLTDSSGVNTVGTSIGHDITAILDENSSKPIILNDYFEPALNSYQAGRVRYPFNELSEGRHTLSFKVWDIQNNSTNAVTDFVVAKSAEVALNHVLNYPNPFTSKTKFLFQHNQGCNPIKVTVQVYTISGKLVKTIQQTVTCDSDANNSVEWDGKDDFGDKLGRGVYIYKLMVLNAESKKAEKIEKLVILN